MSTVKSKHLKPDQTSSRQKGCKYVGGHQGAAVMRSQPSEQNLLTNIGSKVVHITAGGGLKHSTPLPSPFPPVAGDGCTFNSFSMKNVLNFPAGENEPEHVNKCQHNQPPAETSRCRHTWTFSCEFLFLIRDGCSPHRTWKLFLFTSCLYEKLVNKSTKDKSF